MSDIYLYIDEDVRVLLADILRMRGYKALHVLEAGRAGRSDEEQLEYAVQKKMTILTHNIRDFVKLAQTYSKLKKEHYGIVLSAQIPFKELLKRTLHFLALNSREDVKNSLIWLQDYK